MSTGYTIVTVTGALYALFGSETTFGPPLKNDLEKSNPFTEPVMPVALDPLKALTTTRAKSSALSSVAARLFIVNSWRSMPFHCEGPPDSKNAQFGNFVVRVV